MNPIFIDIDGTLTDSPHEPNGRPITVRIEAIKKLIESGQEVIIWSARGSKYARNFAVNHNLNCLCIGKPRFCVDDNPTIRPVMKVYLPDEYFGDENGAFNNEVDNS